MQTKRDLTIYFTSDTHGYFSPVDYASGAPAPTGVANCIANFVQDGNTLILDGGDTIQGSPFTYYLHKSEPRAENAPAKIMNAGGYQFVTLGNHDFNYGRANLEQYLEQLNAVCLCANVEGLSHVQKTAVITLKNGLRIGLTGVATHFINVWEKPENLRGITINEAFPAAEKALQELRKENVDLTVCIYHGGFENDLDTGAQLSETSENQGWRMCRELGFDILLTGHQHIPMENRRVFDTFTCQTPDKAKQYIKMEVSVEDVAESAPHMTARNAVAAGRVQAISHLHTPGAQTQAEAAAYLAPLDAETAKWLDTPVGHLDTELQPDTHIKMAEDGSLIANFFNQVQLEASGADLSATSLGNEVKGFDADVTIRDVVATYIYPNTMATLEVDRAVLKKALERSAEYFGRDADGVLCVSECFLKPKIEHYNYDYISGVCVMMDLSRPVGDRVTSILYQGEELAEDKKLTLCMNNYRATGAGGYEVYKTCPVVREQPTEIVELIMDYIETHRDIVVDKTKWLRVLV
jgi:2',3'-cyclic-nucleotide 2'-phosphodiesterase/3'-nucleotidase